MSHAQHDTTKLLSMIPSLPLSPYSLFSLIFPSGAALILSYIHPTPLHHPTTICPPPSHLLCLSLSLSLRHVISLSICCLLPVPFCSFRFNNISTPSFHFDILHSLHLLAASMNISLVSTPYIYLALIWISLSFSPCMPICLYLLSPSLSGLRSHKGGRRGRDEPEMVNCLFPTAPRRH